ncbi:class I SAM-dependent methyltransferase [Chloroflexota bacterium]|nr:class I SAM-dependent methyltransferase [Chloroflexota bacterium]
MKNNPTLPQLNLAAPTRWQDYELLDSGEGLALERVGTYTLIRSEPQAIWSKALPQSEWKKADAEMITTGGEAGGYWNFRHEIKQPWWIDYHGLQAEIRLAKSRHIGVFPEQASQWDWIEDQIRTAGRPLKVINLFGYTGMATAAAARAGAEVTHVDASKHAVSWASRNIEHSGLAKAPVRWLVEDARKYLHREAKRQSYYDGIILDPPKFGRGPDGRVWSYFEDIADLLDLCRKVLTRQPRFICLTSYAIQASALVPHQALEEMISSFNGHVTSGELVTVEKSKGRILSHSLYSRWTSD